MEQSQSQCCFLVIWSDFRFFHLLVLQILLFPVKKCFSVISHYIHINYIKLILVIVKPLTDQVIQYRRWSRAGELLWFQAATRPNLQRSTLQYL